MPAPPSATGSTPADQAAGLFVDPQMAGLVLGRGLTFPAGPGTDAGGVAGLAPAVIEGFVAVALPALRGLRLAGFRPVAMDLRDPANPDGLAVRIAFDTALSTAAVPAEPDWLDDSFPTFDFALVIHAVPFTSGEGRSYAMQMPLEGADWFVGPGREEDGADGIGLGLVCESPGVPVPGDLALGAVADFVAAMATYLAGEWAPVPQPDAGVPLAAPAKGLLWLLEPRHWYAAGLASNQHAAAVLTGGRDSQIAAGSLPGDLVTYFESQMTGVWRTRETMRAATGKPLRAFFRAGSLKRGFLRWFDSGTAPFGPLPATFNATLGQLPWFDVLCYLVEARVLRPDALGLGGALDEGLDGLDLEPLIARRPPDTTRTIELCLRDLPGTTPANPYGVVARITAEEIPRQNADLLYDPDYPQSPLARDIETMFAWEYIPADPPPEPEDAALAPPPAARVTTPRLVIVAGPGVNVGLSHGLPLRVEVLRKADYGLPVWGERIDPAQLYRPAFITDTKTAPDSVTHNRPGILIVEKPNGIDYNYYQSALVRTADNTPVWLPDAPDARVEITLTNTTNGRVAFRSDIDFVTVSSGQGDLPLVPFLRIWRSGPQVAIKATESAGAVIDLQIYDQPDLYRLTDCFPHVLPVTQRKNGNHLGPLVQTEGSQMVVFGASAAEKLPHVPEADLVQAGFTPVAVENDTAANVTLDYSFGWYDVFLMGVDLVIGLHPYSIALDVAEFFYAYNTGRDRYGRPITTFDLYLMAAGIALPVSGHLLVQVRKGGPALRARWVPPADAVPQDAGDLMQAAGRQADGLQQANEPGLRDSVQMMLSRYADEGAGLLTEAEATLLGATRALANLMDGSGTAFKSFELNYHYRRWLSAAVLGAGQTMNPRGLG